MPSHSTALTLNDLPPPPSGKVGFPWTKQSIPLPKRMPSGSEWKRISIITPSYNQGDYLEETIRSVLLQGYPNLEYILIDGGSRDRSLDIIEKYKKFFAYWVSEPDRGQAHALNKGLAHCTGEIFNWVNSDDYLTQNCLQVIASCFGHSDVVAGTVRNFHGRDTAYFAPRRLSAKELILNRPGTIFHQPGIWLRTNQLRECSGFNENYDYCFDWELMIRYLTHFPKVRYIKRVLSNFRIHPHSKTSQQENQYYLEREEILFKLLELSRYQKLYPFIDLFLRRKRWREQVQQILKGKNLNRLEKVKAIFLSSLSEPDARWNRFTLGAIKHAFFS